MIKLTGHCHRILSTGTVVVLFSLFGSAQVRITALSGFTFQDRFDISGTYLGYRYQEGVLGAGAHYGLGVEYMVGEHAAVEFFGQFQECDGYIRTGLREYGPYKVTVSYFMLGTMHYTPLGDRVSGYGGLALGVGVLGGDGAATKLAAGGKLGALVAITDRLGLKLGMQLTSPIQGLGGGFYYGTGGASAGVSTYSTIFQFGFSGGLSFLLGDAQDGTKPSPVDTRTR